MKYVIHRIDCDFDKYLSENKSWYGNLNEAHLFNSVENAQKEIKRISGDNIGYGVYSGKLGILQYETTLVHEVMNK